MQRSAVVWLSSLLLAFATGCSSKPRQPPQPPREVAIEDQVTQVEKRAELAGERAASEVREVAPAHGDPQRIEKAAAAAKAEAAQREMQKGDADVAIVKAARLNLFLPNSIGAYLALGAVESRDHGGPGPRVAAARRLYESGTRRATVRITDALIAKVLHAPFAGTASIDQTTDNGSRRSLRIKEQPAIVEWRARESISRVAMLVGGRFVVDVRINNAVAAEDAQELAQAMNLATLATLRAKVGKPTAK